MPDLPDLAAILRSARLARGLTQAQLARLVDSNHTLICRYENGLRVPPATLVQLARVLALKLTVEAPAAASTPETVGAAL
jgi:transcriptional regulator with XRE-family HTH domain